MNKKRKNVELVTTSPAWCDSMKGKAVKKVLSKTLSRENNSWKNRFAMLEIAIMLCPMLLMALPAVAADQTTQKTITTASEDDFILEIYGNANVDNLINPDRPIFFTDLGKKPSVGDRFQGIDFDVSEHGVFVYHPEEHPDGR